MNLLLILPLLAAALVLSASGAWAGETRPGLKPCRLQGMEHDALCGVVSRPLNPAEPAGKRIDVHFAVLPALARNRKPDPVLFFAGGPGQSAMELGGAVSRMLSRLSYRRDIVLIDQRGTGRSAPLQCDEPPAQAPLSEIPDTERQVALMRECRSKLQTLPHGDLRFFTTTIAMQDADAVRQALGVERVNIVGGSYGTRAALEYLRQFPQAVRRTVIDGVAPPDMVLPVSMSTDNQAAMDALLAACQADAACRQRHPTLAADWQALLARLPVQAQVLHPMTGRSESLAVTRDLVLGLVRLPLYAPVMSSALPEVLDQAAHGRWEPLLALGSALGPRNSGRMAGGMHFSVVCAEDAPRLALSPDAPGRDFGRAATAMYERICADWPRGEVPAAFYTMPKTATAALVLSGGADPVTPPRHGARVAQALGVNARHVVVPQAGHGVMSLPCMRDVLHRFIDADTDALALAEDAACAVAIPRPLPFAPPGAASAASAGGSR